MIIGFIGFGEAARAFQESLHQRDASLAFAAYDILLDNAATAPTMRSEMERRGVTVAEYSAGIANADWIISAVTADQSLAAIEALAPHLSAGRTVIDINSVSPDRKRKSAALVEKAGATYLDMAVMAPVHPRAHRTPVLVAGGVSPALRGMLERLDFSFRIVGDEVGRATAIKMVRSLFVKGLEAITVEALLAAEASGCFEEIFDSLSSSFAGLGWPEFANYEFERTIRHGKRRAAEMRESAATVAALGLNGRLADEIANVQDGMGGLETPLPEGDLKDVIAAILAARLNSSKT